MNALKCWNRLKDLEAFQHDLDSLLGHSSLHRPEGQEEPMAVAEWSPRRAGVPGRFRRLKWNEVVCHGDFVADERLGLEPWEGPGGFRADTFVKPIYRRKRTGRSQPTATGKSK
jgi:hypothetical protein